MNDLTPENREPIRDLTADGASVHVELHELRQRLAALEATLPERQQTVRKVRTRRRVTRKMLALLVALAVLATATIVFGQDAVDSLFVSPQGNVGIGTKDLGTSKLRIANSPGDFAHFRFDAVGGGEFEFVGWANGWNINTKTAGKNLYLNRDTSSDVWIVPSARK